MTDDRTARRAAQHRWPAFAVVLAAAFMDLVDGTIVSIAMPRVQDDLGAGYAAAQWVLAGYSLAFALALIPGGRLGDVYGRKRVFLVGIAGFTLASAACGAAPNAEVLIASRLLQGLMAGLMVPQVLSVVMIVFAPRERPRAFAVYGTVLSLANVGGPLLGALFTEYDVLGLHWRAIFYVNVPLGVAAFLGALWLMPESRAAGRLRLDLPGVALIAAASFAVMYPLIQGREQGWPVWMLALLAASAPLLLLFGAAQRRRDRADGSALVPPALLRQKPFVLGLVVLLAVFSGLASFFLVLSYALQLGLGWSPLRTALAGLGYPVGILLTTGFAQRYGAVHGRRLTGAGLAVMTAGVVLLIAVMNAAGPGIALWQVAAPIAVMGLGMGLCVSILTGVVLAGVPERDAGAGSGVTNAVLQLGAAAGIAVVGTVQFALTGGGPEAASRMYDSASTTFWYNAAVFLLAALLTPLLPRSTRAAGDGPRGRSAGRQGAAAHDPS
ncbi:MULTISPECIES: MFS transporter [Actinomadura]|uniref:MFS transporter n=1 Tax=Actinomadura yumaensis TaxID=111807 RepID=A0ABW2CDV1_9ACTN|nr:MFS transporter [Actinomadura sp. J1-007]MWK38207.1 MFS transporter [Actinomadura sp. J1-007]